MLREIHIRELGVIEDATLELGPGLNVLTGETGAGKTMVVTSLGLLLGARSDAGLVRAGAQQLLVEGDLAVPPDHPAEARVLEAGGDVSDGILLARSVSASGRSKAYVGGRTAPASVLGEVGEHLVAVHGQADQWRLRSPEEHREVLDGAAGAPVAALTESVRAAHRRAAEARARVERLRSAEGSREARLAELDRGLAELAELHLEPDEELALADEEVRLANVEDLRLAATEAHLALSGEPESAEVTPGAQDLLLRAGRALTSGGGVDPALATLGERIGELGYLAADIGTELAAYLDALDADPARLAWVQQRRADVTSVLRQHGGSSREALRWAESAARERLELDSSDEAVAAAEAGLAEAESELAAAADRLTEARTEAAVQLGAAITAELVELAMPKARVVVSVEPRGRITESGQDVVEIRLASHAKAEPRSVARAASGGELSRVMLAIEVVTASAAGAQTMPTFVFDEVDAGVGGAAATSIGARLAALAEHTQVIVVTHLAQVAAYASHHLVVRKDDTAGTTTVEEVTGAEREREIARMLSGSESTTAIEHAKELLAAAGGGPGHGPRRAGGGAAG